jgi:predicted Zn-dependent protease with MMP-like domain
MVPSRFLLPGRGSCWVAAVRDEPPKPSWKELLAAAEEEVKETLASLPRDLRKAARELPVLYERRPSPELVADGLDPELLGLFVGGAHPEDGHATPLPPQILLFLDNLWEFSEADWEIYLDEVQTTFLHELGHYLGLDEIDLEDRGLE